MQSIDNLAAARAEIERLTKENERNAGIALAAIKRAAAGAFAMTALSERCRVLEEAIHDADQTLMLLGDTGWRRRHRAALAGGRG